MTEPTKQTPTSKKAPTPSTSSSLIPGAITFLAGASYGLTTVLIGQPLDTIKTRMQGLAAASPTTAAANNITSTNSPQHPPSSSGTTNAARSRAAAASSSSSSSSSASASAVRVMRDLYGAEGLRGLYRGGLPLLLGGSFMRSAQFGVSAQAQALLHRHQIPSYTLLSSIDSNVLLSGIAGGLGRALVEIPTDFFKIRRQVQALSSSSSSSSSPITASTIRQQILDGSVVTMGRNTILFASFIVYIDLSRQACEKGYVPRMLCVVEEGTGATVGLTPFMKGAVCANLAWLTCWPMDVVKTQRQSGNYGSGGGAGWKLLVENWRSGRFLRGLVPGLVRSTLANGSSMVVYESVQGRLAEYFGVVREDMV